MVVQHNLRAMNSNRMLGLTASVQSKSTEKLSSGYKINRAADDAAGLSISEKMRKQIRGLSQASLNAQDGISAVQTAEGALNEVQDMLQRMNELAVKAANGTMSEDDRNYIQDEIDQLTKEIDRVSETTKFNETYLLKGDAESATLTTDTAVTLDGLSYTAKSGDTVRNGQKVVLGTVATSTTDMVATGTDAGGSSTLTIGAADDDTVAAGVYTYKAEEATYAAASGKTLYKVTMTSTAGSSAVSYVYQSVAESDMAAAYAAVKASGYDTNEPAAVGSVVAYGFADSGATVDSANAKDADLTFIDENASNINSGIVKTITTKAGWYAEGASDTTDLSALTISNEEAGDKITVTGKKLLENADGTTGSVTGGSTTADAVAAAEEGDKITAYLTVSDTGAVGISATQPTGSDKPLTFTLHVGADSAEDNQISVDIKAMSADALGLLDADGKLLVNGEDDTNALKAIDTVAKALQKVSTQRSALGAVQNRLEHTIANLDNVVENTTAAESQIRDTDMATEMVKYSNNNILAQAGQAMLAQANQSNQGVLSLLG